MISSPCAVRHQSCFLNGEAGNTSSPPELDIKYECLLLHESLFYMKFDGLSELTNTKEKYFPTWQSWCKFVGLKSSEHWGKILGYKILGWFMESIKNINQSRVLMSLLSIGKKLISLFVWRFYPSKIVHPFESLAQHPSFTPFPNSSVTLKSKWLHCCNKQLSNL